MQEQYPTPLFRDRGKVCSTHMLNKQSHNNRHISYKGSTLTADVLCAIWESWKEIGESNWTVPPAVDQKCYKKTLYRLKQQGLLVIDRSGEEVSYRLTAKGEIKTLIIKAKISKPDRWDGKWRLLLFDIPEVAKRERDKLRSLLKQVGFKQLQQSVFIYPYQLNQEAVEYLKQTGLIAYINILRVDKMDEESRWLKLFNITRNKTAPKIRARGK